MIIAHHGIKGQKWGVRRYQNYDGSLTAAGRERLGYRNNIIRNRRYTDDVNNIVSSLSSKEKRLLGAYEDEDWIDTSNENEILSNKIKTILTKVGDTPVSFLEIWATNGGKTGQIAIATRSGEQYRGKGYASKEVEQALKWMDRYGNKTLDELEWIAEKSNAGSNELAKKYGFQQVEPPNTDAWRNYNRYIKKS